jgi:hypothetical protein
MPGRRIFETARGCQPLYTEYDEAVELAAGARQQAEKRDQ